MQLALFKDKKKRKKSNSGGSNYTERNFSTHKQFLKRIVYYCKAKIIVMKTPVSKITEGIKISVKTKFLNEQSSHENNYYLFSYKITIENKSEYTVQLLTRHWDIFDSNYEHREVDGEGVVGEQPILAPEGKYEYESACSLTTDIGSMKGYYTLQRSVDKSEIKVLIPEFELIAPFRLN